ncbi:hypothetical protein GFS24_07550 [Chitinophaga sp. SYP-B3965]|uniref:hypothetical protein n=1 Tax=Chitinophaga sp. SYP-B3965 TaxID=2663120 RepID=UPI001299F240|nr:hypothetical protein [Chitinophaga sp. SYP-B3965]MRG44963.1 hypothetical protein [Chitinophaga sp. SYP-B3965]
MKKAIKLTLTATVVIALSSFVSPNKFAGTSNIGDGSFKIVKCLNTSGITKINAKVPFYQRFYRKAAREGVNTPIVIGNSTVGVRAFGLSYSEPFQIILPSNVPIPVLMMVIKYRWQKDNDDPSNTGMSLTISPMYEATDDSGNPLPINIANQIFIDMQDSDKYLVGSTPPLAEGMNPVKPFTLHFYGIFPITGGGTMQKYFQISGTWEDFSGEFYEELYW